MPNTFGDDNTFKQCLPPKDCVVFTMFDPSNDGRAFTIRQNDHLLFDQKRESFNIKKVPLGKCNPRQCPDGHSLFEIDIGTDERPYQIYWRLFDSNYTILASRDIRHYRERMKYHYFQKCVPSNDCLTLTMHDTWTPRDTNYIVTLDGVIIQEGRQLGQYLNVIRIGKCHIPTCSWNQTSFEFDIYTRNNPETFSWQLLNSTNAVIMAGG